MTVENFFQTRSARLRKALVIGAVALLPAAGVSASSDKEDIARCKTVMIEEHQATEVRDLKHVHHEDVPYVYGNADFADVSGLHFRCKIYHGKVRKVRFLVKDPEFVDGRAWAKNRPRGKEHEDLDLDDAAMAPPPIDPPAPHFIKVPRQP